MYTCQNATLGSYSLKEFFLDPPKAYSEVLEKSIGGPRKRKEVFELSALTGPQG
jgi:hypothetical protein